METELYEINVTLSKYQKEKLFEAFINCKQISLFLENDALTGEDTLLVPEKSFVWDIKHSISDEETFPNFIKRQENKCALNEETFSEMLYNGFYLVYSMNDGGLKKFRLCTPPTINDRLEEARKNNETMVIILDYSLLNESTEYSIFKNLRKLM